MICDQTSFASRKSGACEPTKPEPLGESRSRLSLAPWMLFMNSEPVYIGRPGAAQVYHSAGVGMAAAGRVGPAVAAVRVGPEVMPVVGDRLDVVIGVWIEMLACLALVPAALDHVIEMRDDARGDEHLPAGIEVDAPGVARAVCEDFEDVPHADGSARCPR